MSLITFIVGLKFGKNQQDREMKQNIYKNLYLELKNIQNSLVHNEPINYGHYDTIKTSNNRYVSATPLKKLEHTGDIIYLNKEIIDELIEVEKEYFLWSYKVSKETLKNIFEALPKSTEVLEGKIKANSYHNSDDNHFECSNSTASSYRSTELSVLDFAFNNERAINKIKEMAIGGDESLHISYTQKGKILYSYTVQSTSIKNKTKFIDYLIENLNEKINEDELISSKNYHIERYNSIAEKIEKKAIDPDGFWETLINSFKDVFTK